MSDRGKIRWVALTVEDPCTPIIKDPKLFLARIFSYLIIGQIAETMKTLI